MLSLFWATLYGDDISTLQTDGRTDGQVMMTIPRCVP